MFQSFKVLRVPADRLSENRHATLPRAWCAVFLMLAKQNEIL